MPISSTIPVNMDNSVVVVVADDIAGPVDNDIDIAGPDGDGGCMRGTNAHDSVTMEMNTNRAVVVVGRWMKPIMIFPL